MSLGSVLSGGSLGSFSLQSGAVGVGVGVGVVPVQLARSHAEPQAGIGAEDVKPSEEV